MFTGLVEQKGEVSGLYHVQNGWQLTIECGAWRDGTLVPGESIAVQGVCLTVAAREGNGFRADLLDETLRRSALGSLRRGAPVNLERALRLGDRLGGHLVSGHIDEAGRVLSIRKVGRDYQLHISCSEELSGQCVMKGSIAIDGVSLTISGLDDKSLSVNIIPHTWHITSLGHLRPQDAVNLEADMLGKYVARQLRTRGGEISATFLENAGFYD